VSLKKILPFYKRENYRPKRFQPCNFVLNITGQLEILTMKHIFKWISFDETLTFIYTA
jgi:hypothetical protein